MQQKQRVTRRDLLVITSRTYNVRSVAKPRATGKSLVSTLHGIVYCTTLGKRKRRGGLERS